MHYIEYFEMSNDVPKKKTLKMFQDLANREGDYKDQIEGIKWITDMTLNDERAATKYLDEHRIYPGVVAVKFKDGRRKPWLFRIEFHC